MSVRWCCLHNPVIVQIKKGVSKNNNAVIVFVIIKKLILPSHFFKYHTLIIHYSFIYVSGAYSRTIIKPTYPFN